jgi:hypothetical protein
VGAGDPRLQQSAACAGQFAVRNRFASCAARNAARQHAHDGAGRGGGRVAVRGGPGRWRCEKPSATAGTPMRWQPHCWDRRNPSCGDVPAPPGGVPGGNGQSGAVHVVAGHDEAAAGGGGGHMASRVGAADRDSWPLQRPGVWLCGYICPGLAGGRSVAATGG